MVRIPVTAHAPTTSAGEFAVRAISASTRKTPDPIMDPATIALELKRPSDCTSFGASAAASESWTGVSFVLGTGLVLLDLSGIVLLILAARFFADAKSELTATGRSTA